MCQLSILPLELRRTASPKPNSFAVSARKHLARRFQLPETGWEYPRRWSPAATCAAITRHELACVTVEVPTFCAVHAWAPEERVPAVSIEAPSNSSS